MNKKESFVHIKAVLEQDWRVEKCEVNMEEESFTITPYHGLSKEPFYISVKADNELAALNDIIRRFKDEGILE